MEINFSDKHDLPTKSRTNCSITNIPYDANNEWRRVYDKDEPMDKHGFMKDFLFKNHKEEYAKWFNWPKDSKRAARRQQRGTLESDNSKTWQSLRAFDALSRKQHNVKRKVYSHM